MWVCKIKEQTNKTEKYEQYETEAKKELYAE